VWLRWFLLVIMPYSRADNSRPVSFADCAWEWVYATNLSRLQRERERNKRRVREAQRTYYLNGVVTEANQCHCACSPILSLTCVWRLRSREHRPKSAGRPILAIDKRCWWMAEWGCTCAVMHWGLLSCFGGDLMLVNVVLVVENAVEEWTVLHLADWWITAPWQSTSTAQSNADLQLENKAVVL
jgi:hypothetical protein